MRRPQRRYTPRRPATVPDADVDLLRRRYRQLLRRLCVPAIDEREHAGSAEMVKAVGAKLHRDVEGVDDPAERVAIAEQALAYWGGRLAELESTR